MKQFIQQEQGYHRITKNNQRLRHYHSQQLQQRNNDNAVNDDVYDDDTDSNDYFCGTIATTDRANVALKPSALTTTATNNSRSNNSRLRRRRGILQLLLLFVGSFFYETIRSSSIACLTPYIRCSVQLLLPLLLGSGRSGFGILFLYNVPIVSATIRVYSDEHFVPYTYNTNNDLDDCNHHSCDDTTVTTNTNETITIQSYTTLPGLFGKYMVDDKSYVARIQYWPENPYLCSVNPHTSFKPSVGIMLPENHNPFLNDNPLNDNTGNHKNGIHIPGDPILLLVARGNCPFDEKAKNAERIDPNIIFMAVYNTVEDDDNGTDNNKATDDTALVPMYSEFDTTRLVLLRYV